MSELSPPPGSDINITSATWRDVKDLYQLEKVCFQVDAWPILDVMGVLTMPQVIRLKTEHQGKMIGFIAVDLRRMQGTAWIITFAVMPKYRRTGIGSALLTACESQIKLPNIRLSVRQSNLPAIAFYQKHHYQQVDVWVSYYKGGDNALVFEKNL